jgi:hypothetical protein
VKIEKTEVVEATYTLQVTQAEYNTLFASLALSRPFDCQDLATKDGFRILPVDNHHGLYKFMKPEVR